MKKKSLDNLILPGINFVVGAAKGTFDVLTTGLPLLSGGSELWRVASYLDSKDSKSVFDISIKDVLSYSCCSLIGASIPFGIKYYNEIYKFVEGVLK